jgi:hypothetical protein
VPFAGVYGGTAGAGSVLGWDRSVGENPAVLGRPGWSVAVAGYAPFGLADLRRVDASAAWDRERWGLSASYGGTFAPEAGRTGEVADAALGFQSAMKLRQGLTAGIAGLYQAAPGNSGAGIAGGLLWRPRPWGGLGGFWSAEETRWGREARAGIGVDGGFGFSGMAVRLGAEALHGGARWETRFAAGLQLHALLSLYLGWDPPRRTAALGARFGIGGWEGYSAMRRHAALGGTSVQGIRWRDAPVAGP